MKITFNKVYYRAYEKLKEEKEQLVEKDRSNQQEINRLQRAYEIERKEKERCQARIIELEKQNEALMKEVARLNGIINLDGTNSGTPTSKTPLNKKKHVPNTREATGKTRGGQPGHPKAKLNAFQEEEITEDEIHGYERCPECGGELEETGENW